MPKVTFTFEVDGREPRSVSCRGGASLLEVAKQCGITIDHACGGFCACSTCHVIVKDAGESLSEITDPEEDMLENAPGLTLSSRLACQARVGVSDVVVLIPAHGKNEVVSDH